MSIQGSGKVIIGNYFHPREEGLIITQKKELSLSEIFEASYQLVYFGKCRGEYFEQHGLELIPFSQDDILNDIKVSLISIILVSVKYLRKYKYLLED